MLEAFFSFLDIHEPASQPTDQAEKQEPKMKGYGMRETPTGKIDELSEGVK